MTLPDTITVVVGLALTLAAGWISGLAGRFSFTLHGLKSPIPAEVSRAYLNVRTRWALYYVPTTVMTVAAALLMPHWILAAVAVLFVAYWNKSGARSQLLGSVDRMTRFYIEEGMEEEDAFAAANSTIGTIAGFPEGVTNYSWRNYKRRIPPGGN